MVCAGDNPTGKISTQPEAWGGLLASLALHGIFVLAIVMLVSGPVSVTRFAPFVPVDLVHLDPPGKGNGSGTPDKIIRLSAPHTQKSEAATPRNAAISAHGVKDAEDSLDAKLRSFARLKQPNMQVPSDNGSGDAMSSLGGGDGEGSYSVRDYVRAQILRRWNLNLAKMSGRHFSVHIRIVMKRSGAITDAEVVGGPADASSEGAILYRDIALSARNAAMLASPIALPKGEYPSEMRFVLDLNPRDVQH